MLKNLFQVNEVEESHKFKGYSQNKDEKDKKDKMIKEKDKLIHPKYIFDGKVKGVKLRGRGGYRAPTKEVKESKINLLV